MLLKSYASIQQFLQQHPCIDQSIFCFFIRVCKYKLRLRFRKKEKSPERETEMFWAAISARIVLFILLNKPCFKKRTSASNPAAQRLFPFIELTMRSR